MPLATPWLHGACDRRAPPSANARIQICSRRLWARALFLTLWAFAALPHASHASGNNKGQGQGQGTTAPASTATPTGPTRLVSTSATGDLYRLLLQYEPVPAGQPTVFTMTVSDLQSGAPVTGAAVELRLVGAHAELRPWLPPAAEPGHYTATVTFPVDGDYAAVAQVTREGEIDLVLFPLVRVGALPGTAAGAAHVRLQQILLGAVMLFILGMLTLSFVVYRRSSRADASPTPPPA